MNILKASIFYNIRSFFSSASEMLFPACCEVCGQSLVNGETMLCLSCDYDMPRTHIEQKPFNPIHERLASPGLPIEGAAAYFYYYKDNSYARLIQHAKYSSRPEIARFLGMKYSKEILPTGFFDDIDLILPMPLHFLKRLRRGYNQTEIIAEGVSQITGIPIGDNLKIKKHRSQTRLTAKQRRANMSGLISVKHANELSDKHLLVIDDVITTGATMFNAIKALHSLNAGIKISVMSLGLTKLS